MRSSNQRNEVTFLITKLINSGYQIWVIFSNFRILTKHCYAILPLFNFHLLLDRLALQYSSLYFHHHLFIQKIDWIISKNNIHWSNSQGSHSNDALVVSLPPHFENGGLVCIFYMATNRQWLQLVCLCVKVHATSIKAKSIWLQKENWEDEKW